MIVSGGTLEEKFTMDILNDPATEYIIGVDKGNAFLYEHEICPDYIVGDFDSLPGEILEFYEQKKSIPIRRFDPVKDATDTEIAVKLAIEFHKENVVILGATGSRIDHVWGNVQMMKIGLDAGLAICTIDSHNRITLINKKIVLRRAEAFGPYFSVFPLGGKVEDFNIKGAKYPLTQHTLTPYDSLCVSNQFGEDTVEIDFPEGTVVLMETRD